MTAGPLLVARILRGCNLAWRLCAALALGVMGSMHAAAADIGPDSGAVARTVVFVGERLSIGPMPDPCDEAFRKTGLLECISMDSLYRTTFRVVLPVVGEAMGEEMTFSVADHYGFPYFARFDHALLFVEVGEDGAWLHKYQAVPMHRTGDGRWAACGDMRYRSDVNPLIALARPMTLARPILTLRDLDPDVRDRLSSRWKDAPDTYRVSRGQVHCLKGVLVEEVYGIVREGVMAAREVSLPAWPAVP